MYQQPALIIIYHYIFMQPANSGPPYDYNYNYNYPPPTPFKMPYAVPYICLIGFNGLLFVGTTPTS